MASAACERAKLGLYNRPKRSVSVPGVEGGASLSSDLPSRSVSQQLQSGCSQTSVAGTEGSTAGSPIGGGVSEASLAERWTDSIRRTGRRLRHRLSVRRDRSSASSVDATRRSAASLSASEPSSQQQQSDTRKVAVKRAADQFWQPARRFGKVASRSAVGKPVVRFARTCRRDVPKPYLLVRNKLRSVSPHSRRRLSEQSLPPRRAASVCVEPTASSQLQLEEQLVYEDGSVDATQAQLKLNPASVDKPQVKYTEGGRASVVQVEAEICSSAPSDQFPVSLSVTDHHKGSPVLSAQTVDGKTAQRDSRNVEFPKPYDSDKSFTIEADAISQFVPLSTSSSKAEDLGTSQVLEQDLHTRIRSSIVQDSLSKAATNSDNCCADLAPLRIEQLDQPPRVFRPRSEISDQSKVLAEGDKQAARRVTRPQRPPLPLQTTLSRIHKPVVENGKLLASGDDLSDELFEKNVTANRPVSVAAKEPYTPRQRQYWEQKQALSQKPQRKRKKDRELADQRARSADRVAAESRVIDIFGTAARPPRRSRATASAVTAVPVLPPARPPPPSRPWPYRPARHQPCRHEQGTVSLLDVRDLHYVDDSATEDSGDYREDRPERPNRRHADAAALTSRLVIDVRSGASIEQQQLLISKPYTTCAPRPVRHGCSDLSPTGSCSPTRDVRDSVEITGQQQRCQTSRSSSVGPRSINSLHHEDSLGSGDELMLLVHATVERVNKENCPSQQTIPSYAHVEKRCCHQRHSNQEEGSNPAVTPKSAHQYISDTCCPTAPPRQRFECCWSEQVTTWPKRKCDRVDAVRLATPPRSNRRRKPRSSTLPHPHRPSRAHLQQHRSSDNMMNRPLPAPPAPPRRRSPPITCTDGLSEEATLHAVSSDETTLSRSAPQPLDIDELVSTDEEFFSVQSGSGGVVPTQVSMLQPSRPAPGAPPPAPRHARVPHLMQRVSASELDVASANILSLTAGRIRVTELEVDRIYIREGRVQLVRRQEDGDGEGGAAPQPPSSAPSAAAPSANNGQTPSGLSSRGVNPDHTSNHSTFTNLSVRNERDQGCQTDVTLQQDSQLLSAVSACAADLPAADSESHTEKGALTTNLADPLDVATVARTDESSPSPPLLQSDGRLSRRATVGRVVPRSDRKYADICDKLERTLLSPQICQRLGSDGDAPADTTEESCNTEQSDGERIYGVPRAGGSAGSAGDFGSRSRLNSILSSFGKGLKKRRSGSRMVNTGHKARRSSTHFYVDIDSSCSSTTTDCEELTRHVSDSSLVTDRLPAMGTSSSSPLFQATMAPGHRLTDGRLKCSHVGSSKLDSGRYSSCDNDGVLPVEQELDCSATKALSECGSAVDLSATSAGGGSERPLTQMSDDSDDYESDADSLYTAQQHQDRPSTATLTASRTTDKAFLVACELMTSEQTFYDVLRLLNGDLRTAVLEASDDAGGPALPAAELESLLGHLPQMERFSESLLADLRARVHDWQQRPVIADVLVHKGPFLKLYSAYIGDFQAQCHLLEECRHRYPAFGRVLEKFEASERCRKLSVAHFMLKPVQRIPQYRMLLEDYLRQLSADGPDYDNTRAALEIVCDVANHVNNKMKDGDNFKKLLQLQERIRCTEIVRPGRSILREGQLLKLCRKGPQPRFLILLTDCLLLTRGGDPSVSLSGTGSGQLQLDYMLPLVGMRVSVPLSVTEEWQNEFSVVSTSRSFSLIARDCKERDVWVNAIMDAIEKNAAKRSTFNAQPLEDSVYDPKSGIKLGQRAPIWVPDSRASMCQLCTTEFTVTLRRHHCRACGRVVCASCSAQRVALFYLENAPARVCDVCFDSLQNDLQQGNIDADGDSLVQRPSITTLGRKNARKQVPKRLEVQANDAGSAISGYLQQRSRKQWKRRWFVLRLDRVLYVYRASHDVVAIDSLPVLGYRVQSMSSSLVKTYEGVDTSLVFQLTHTNQPPLIFHAENAKLADRWVSSLQRASVLT